MKKSLIALAALAFVSVASAQSSTTISGNLDFAASSNSGNTTTANNGNTIATTTGTSSTSVLRFIAVEDLGGGLRATAQYNFDPRAVANDNGALGRDEMFLALSGGFGNIRLGSPNSIGLHSFLDSSPLGTGIGSAYGGMTTSYVQTRYSRSVRYNSPTINGFTASAMYAPGGDNATSNTIPNARKATELGLAYANGPLKVSYAYVAQNAQVNGSPNTAQTSVSLINANYKLGKDTTLYAGWNKGDALAATGTAAPTDTKGYRVAVKHDIGAISLMAQYTTQNSRTAAQTADVKAKTTGLRADYNLSKTAAVYLGYENFDSGAATANSRKITSVGLRKSF